MAPEGANTIMYHFICRGWNCEKYEQKCVESINNQTIKDTMVWKIIDGKPDRLGVCYNIYHGIHWCNAQDEDVLCFLDLDDYLLSPVSLEFVDRAYRKHPNTLVTYGSYINSETGDRGKNCLPYPEGVRPREYKWRASHLKTMKYKVAKNIPEEYFMNGHRWGLAASDLALMFSAMEIAGMENCRFIKEPVYYYRANTPYTCNRGTQKKWNKIFRAKKPLERLF